MLESRLFESSAELPKNDAIKKVPGVGAGSEGERTKAAEREEWKKHADERGRVYFFHIPTNTSVWERPLCLSDTVADGLNGKDGGLDGKDGGDCLRCPAHLSALGYTCEELCNSNPPNRVCMYSCIHVCIYAFSYVRVCMCLCVYFVNIHTLCTRHTPTHNRNTSRTMTWKSANSRHTYKI